SIMSHQIRSILFSLFLADALYLAFSPLSLHDALPILWPVMTFFTNSTIHMVAHGSWAQVMMLAGGAHLGLASGKLQSRYWRLTIDRKSTRLNSSHVSISYAVVRLKKKNNKQEVRH